jgi:Holliday junction DNA helicase RuvB
MIKTFIFGMSLVVAGISMSIYKKINEIKRDNEEGYIDKDSVSDEEEVERKSALMVDSPTTFKDFIGQEKAIQLLRIHVKAAQMRDRVVPHIILEGPGGAGKTTMAMCVAHEINSRFFITTPSTFKDRNSVMHFFFDKEGICKIEKGDVIFIDEIHRLREAAAIYIYSAMQDYYMDLGGDIAELPEFTVVGATTDLGMLPSPFRDRFKIRLVLDKYAVPDIAKIVTEFKKIDPEVAVEIAKRSCGIPRIAKSISDNVIAYAIYSDKEEVDMECVDMACDLLEIDDKGINKSARKAIRFLQNNSNTPMGVSSLSSTLNISKDTMNNEIYPVLFAQELLMSKGTRGKCLTEKGLKYECED